MPTPILGTLLKVCLFMVHSLTSHMAGFYCPNFSFETTRGQMLNSTYQAAEPTDGGARLEHRCDQSPSLLRGCCLSYKLKASSFTSENITTHFIARLVLLQDSYCLGLEPNPQYLPGLCVLLHHPRSIWAKAL